LQFIGSDIAFYNKLVHSLNEPIQCILKAIMHFVKMMQVRSKCL